MYQKKEHIRGTYEYIKNRRTENMEETEEKKDDKGDREYIHLTAGSYRIITQYYVSVRNSLLRHFFPLRWHQF